MLRHVSVMDQDVQMKKRRRDRRRGQIRLYTGRLFWSGADCWRFSGGGGPSGCGLGKLVVSCCRGWAIDRSLNDNSVSSMTVGSNQLHTSEWPCSSRRNQLQFSSLLIVFVTNCGDPPGSTGYPIDSRTDHVDP